MKKQSRYIQVLTGLVVVYLFYALAKTLYQSYVVHQDVERLKVSVEEIRSKNRELSDKIIYYQSSSYREKIARERMGLQKAGEEVIVILPEERPKITEESAYDALPNYMKWWKFFF